MDTMPRTKRTNRSTTTTARDYATFAAEVAKLMDGTAAGKGYNRTGLDGPNRLFEFVLDNIGAGAPTHALGEVVYKCQRYASKKNPEDILKAAAWCFLIWRHHR
jgi:hypothetical protein